MTKTDKVFCPKCGCKDYFTVLGCENEWVDDYTIVADESYACRQCGHEFSIHAYYCMTSYYDNDTEKDIAIEEE